MRIQMVIRFLLIVFCLSMMIASAKAGINEGIENYQKRHEGSSGTLASEININKAIEQFSFALLTAEFEKVAALYLLKSYYYKAEFAVQDKDEKKKNFNVYVVIGDGECNEGSIWEAAMAAPNFALDNLYVIIDKNNFQQTGSNKEIMNVENLKDKWSSFGWYTSELDGHNIKDLYNFFKVSKSIKKPKAIIANTVKGKGFSFSENNNDWHHSILSKSFYEKAMNELKKK